MLQNDSEVREVRNITNEDKQRIEDFLQGAIYSWCKNNKDKWFALYEKHKNKDNATVLAGKDASWILKKVIKNDKRTFDTKKEEMTRKYKWIK